MLLSIITVVLQTSEPHDLTHPTVSRPPKLFHSELPAGAVKVAATGRDFFWDFRYPGADDKFDKPDDLCVERELHLPLDRDIVLLVTSDDNVYTLSIPELNLRRIAVPELTYTLEFRTTSLGSFDIVMDPMCSVRLFQEGPMGRLVVQPRAEFEKWLAAVPARPTTPRAAR